MSDLHMQICELLDEGLKPISVAGLLGIPLEMVYDVIDAELLGESDVEEISYNEDLL
jgi:hypothetical protein